MMARMYVKTQSTPDHLFANAKTHLSRCKEIVEKRDREAFLQNPLFSDYGDVVTHMKKQWDSLETEEVEGLWTWIDLFMRLINI